MTRARPLRRFLAFGLDYVVISAYLAALVGVGVALNVVAPSLVEAAFGGRVRAQAAGFLVVTLPVTLYFAVMESSAGQATWGKRRLGLRVTTAAGDRAGFGRALVRTAVKFLPWELAHTVVWHIVFHGAESATVTAALAGVWALVIAYLVSVFLARDGRAIHDRVAGTRVVQATAARVDAAR